jgi:uncharacterized protein
MMQSLRKKIIVAVMMFAGFSAHATEPASDYPIQPVPAHKVQFCDAFWRPRLEANRTATIPLSFQMCEETGRIENFKVAGGLSDADWTGMFGFNDSDVFKIMEGAAYSLMTHPDGALQAYLQDLVGYVAAAQEDDGYLFTAWTARDRIADPKQIRCCVPGEEKWLAGKDSHELYNIGHMYEAAVAHWEATGDRSFLEVAVKSANLLADTFGPGKIELPPGHPELELALVKLYRTTGDERYLQLARFFLDVRGRPTDERPQLWGENRVDHKPLVQQEEAVGHAVRAIYLYAAATDVAALTGDQALSETVDRLWKNVAGKKTYVTGGIGATRQGEAFGKNYDLPNESAYAETCANLATCLWNHRMFLWHGDGKYIDLLERSLYNGTISGVALDGQTFFYPNPLASRGGYSRSKWFDCACCPTNICRFIPSVPGYVYATRDDAVYVNMFVAGQSELALADGNVRIEQKTSYPWNGKVTIRLTPETPGQRIAMKIRIPGWARGEAFPTDLYRFADEAADSYTVAVNDQPVESEVVDGFVTIDREWQADDSVTLNLPMSIRRVVANDMVEACRGHVALMRGPLVYCIEWPDIEGGEVQSLLLPNDAKLTSEFRNDLLGGVQVIAGTGLRRTTASDAPSKTSNAGQTKASEPPERLPFIAIPYYAWAHRGPGDMAVWLKAARSEPKER